MNVRRLFIPKKTRRYMKVIHLFNPKRQEVIWTLDICLSQKTRGYMNICLFLNDKRLYEL